MFAMYLVNVFLVLARSLVVSAAVELVSLALVIALLTRSARQVSHTRPRNVCEMSTMLGIMLSIIVWFREASIPIAVFSTSFSSAASLPKGDAVAPENENLTPFDGVSRS